MKFTGNRIEEPFSAYNNLFFHGKLFLPYGGTKKIKEIQFQSRLFNISHIFWSKEIEFLATSKFKVKEDQRKQNDASGSFSLFKICFNSKKFLLSVDIKATRYGKKTWSLLEQCLYSESNYPFLWFPCWELITNPNPETFLSKIDISIDKIPIRGKLK